MLGSFPDGIVELSLINPSLGHRQCARERGTLNSEEGIFPYHFSFPLS